MNGYGIRAVLLRAIERAVRLSRRLGTATRSSTRLP
jgi:hypothetical protein